MAIELAQAYVSITPSARGIGRSLSRELTGPLGIAGASAGDSAATSFGRRFTPALARIGRQAGLALTGAIGAAGFFGIRTAANFEQTRIAFEGILGDVDEANRLLGQLRDFAAKTPFEFTGLADAAKNLLAVGFTTEDIIPTMTTLGNVAATLGVGEAEIAGVVRALGQMKGKGRASAEELQQISEQIPGFSAIKVIAEDMGISVSEAFDLMAKGRIPATDAIESILNGMEDFPGAAGAMERQSKTLNGVISTFKDTLATTAIDFITPYLPALSTAVSRFGGFIADTLVPGLQTFVSWVGDIVDRVGPGIVRFFEDHLIPTVKGLAEDGLQAIKDWWDRNGTTVTAFFVTFGDVAGTVLGTLGDFIWQQVLPALNGVRDWFANNEAAIVAVLAAVAAGFALWAVNAALAAAATVLANLPLIVLIGIVGLIAAALYYAYTNWGWFKTGIDGAIIAALIFFGAMRAVYDVIADIIGIIDRAIDKIEILRKNLQVSFPLLGIGTGGGTAEGVSDFLDREGRGRAGGGPVSAGMPYVVGEERAELFVPDVNGTVLPTVPGAFGSAPITVQVIERPGENSAETAVRELRRLQLLAAA